MFEWRAAYDAAGIRDDDAPPNALVAEAATADRLIASDLPRAIASMERLAPGREMELSPLLRETPLALPPVPFPLPLTAWEVLISARWFAERAVGRRGAPEELARARDAVDWLIERVSGDRSVVVVTHGAFRVLLGWELGARGWKPDPAGARRYHNWSDWTFLSG